MARKALLIIDMQRGDFPPLKDRYQAEVIVERIRKLAAAFRATGHQVIYIQHDGTAEGAFSPGTQEWEILPELTPMPTDLVVSKTANDAFYNSSLLETLHQNGLRQIFIAGSATDFCVDATIKGGLTKNLMITVASDAHTAADRPYVSAEHLIGHYNWVWSHMTPTRGAVRTRTYTEIINMLS